MLANRTILITGSSRGIGAATARMAKEYGAHVILHGKTDSEELRKMAKEIGAPYFFCDVADNESVEREIAKFEHVDILVNNAGVNPSKTFGELTHEDWQQIFNTNVFGVVNVSKAILPGMIQRGGGKIINIASIKGYLYTNAKPAYAATKAAVMRITSSMAEEFAPYHILVNAVAPGFCATEMTKASMSPVIQRQIDKIPLKRMALPNEIAEVILFLASDKANYITGQTVAVDGGYTITC